MKMNCNKRCCAVLRTAWLALITSVIGLDESASQAFSLFNLL